MWEAFRRYKALDGEARRLFWRAVTLLSLTRLSLRLRGFKKTKTELQKKLTLNSPQRMVKQNDAETVQMTCRMVRAGAHYGLGRPSCLEESLVLWYLLQSQNIPARLRIGVQKVAEKFAAHAWVEFEGTPLNEGEPVHQHYAAFEGEFSDMPGEQT
jgi:hypothetical protein